MAEDGQENGMNTPDFDETDGPEGKSNISILKPKAQYKATIDSF